MGWRRCSRWLDDRTARSQGSSSPEEDRLSGRSPSSSPAPGTPGAGVFVRLNPPDVPITLDTQSPIARDLTNRLLPRSIDVAGVRDAARTKRHGRRGERGVSHAQLLRDRDRGGVPAARVGASRSRRMHGSPRSTQGTDAALDAAQLSLARLRALSAPRLRFTTPLVPRPPQSSAC